MKARIILLEPKNWPVSQEFVRFSEKATGFLFDCKLMDDGVIVRQCPPNEWNMFHCSFEEFMNRFQESYC
jgi:hypothetical protein